MPIHRLNSMEQLSVKFKALEVEKAARALSKEERRQVRRWAWRKAGGLFWPKVRKRMGAPPPPVLASFPLSAI
jgi:hypothetical protein